MSKEITIPPCRDPFVVIVNGIRYEYKSGESIAVPDEVAEVIQFHVDSKPKALPIPEGGGTGGDSSGDADSGGGADAGASIDFDLLQNSGTRTNYTGAFAYWSTDDNFRPIYPINASSNGTRMFEKSKITNLEKLLEDRGISITIGPRGATTSAFEFCFLNSEVTHLLKMPIADYTRLVTTAKN